MSLNDAAGSFVPQAGTVLVIDADQSVGQNLARHLEAKDVRVMVAQTGTQGYWLALSKQPDAVVTDLAVRNESGAPMLECLKDNSHTEKIPVVVLADQEYPGMQQHLENLGAAAVLPKPQPADHLCSIVRQVMTGSAMTGGAVC